MTRTDTYVGLATEQPVKVPLASLEVQERVCEVCGLKQRHAVRIRGAK